MNLNNTPIPSGSAPKFRGEILTKIYRVWLIRKLLPVLLLEVVVLSLLLYYLGRSVFVERVIANGLNVLFAHPTKILPFLAAAFSNAGITIKILSVGIAVVLALFLRHITQGALRLILVKTNYFSRFTTEQ